jgi:hypothetical protein
MKGSIHRDAASRRRQVAAPVLADGRIEVSFRGITTVIRPTLIVGPGYEADRFTYWPVRLDPGGDVPASWAAAGAAAQAADRLRS